MTFAALVKSRLTEKKISLRELCRRSDMDPSLLSKALVGKRNPPSDDGTLTRLARALDISPAELFVSAGKIPREWRRIQSDRELFENVCRVMEHFIPKGRGACRKDWHAVPHPKIYQERTVPGRNGAIAGGGGGRPTLPARENAAAETYKQQPLAEELL